MISPTILIAAGGTGGHIYPALSVAEAIRELNPQARVEFVGTRHGMENKILQPRGYTVHHLPIGRLHASVGLMERLLTLLCLPLAFLKSLLVLLRARPALVLGVGGHASGPLLLMAALLRFPTAIWEPNAHPGLANRWLSRFVDASWLVFPDAKSYLHTKNIYKAGMPVREEVERSGRSGRSGQSGLSGPRRDSDFHILVTGGSQGARGINNAVVDLVNHHADQLQGVRFVHQTGSVDFARVRDAYKGAQIEVHEYLHDMDQRYAWADLVICRAGTGTLSELAACGKAAILIPLPTASDDHQRKNAESLVNKGAARLLLQANATHENLLQMIDEIRFNPALKAELENSIRKFHEPGAAKKLAQALLSRDHGHTTL